MMRGQRRRFRRRARHTSSRRSRAALTAARFRAARRRFEVLPIAAFMVMRIFPRHIFLQAAMAPPRRRASRRISGRAQTRRVYRYSCIITTLILCIADLYRRAQSGDSRLMPRCGRRCHDFFRRVGQPSARQDSASRRRISPDGITSASIFTMPARCPRRFWRRI